MIKLPNLKELATCLNGTLNYREDDWSSVKFLYDEENKFTILISPDGEAALLFDSSMPTTQFSFQTNQLMFNVTDGFFMLCFLFVDQDKQIPRLFIAGDEKGVRHFRCYSREPESDRFAFPQQL